MSDQSSLIGILGEEDLKQIPTNLQTTLNCFLESKGKILDIERQRHSLLEKDYNDLKTKVDYQSDLVNRYKKHIAELEDELHKARRELCDSNHEKDCLNVELKNERLELRSKDEQVTKLDELIRSKNEETVKLIESNRKLQIDIEQVKRESTSSDLNGEHFHNLLNEKEKLFNLECNYLKGELDRITNDFHEKCSKYNSLASEHTIYKSETELQLNDLKKENGSMKTQNTFLTNLIEKKDNQINDLALKLNELHQHQDLLKEQYNIEKKEHNDLINYYKKLLDESKNVKNDLLEKIKELHVSFTESNEGQKLIQDKLNHLNIMHDEEIKAKDEFSLQLKHRIQELELQLINLNQKEVNDAMKQFYPTSNTLSKMLEKNMPLSTVYSKYEEQQAKCEELINENDELKDRIQEMIAESEKNAPLIFYKTQENKKAYAEIEEYKTQLTKVSSDLENALSEIENYNKINNYLKRELKRYEKSNVDLSRQVQCLIQTVHEIKGNFVSTKFLINDEFLDKESAFDKAISLNLVTFRNIEEIHNNNQKLLSSIRELSEQYQELQDKYNHGDNDEESRKHIDELLVEIENLKEENRHKQEILSEMMNERESKLNQSGKHDTSVGKDKQASSSTLFKITSRAYLEEKIAELSNCLEKRNLEFDQFTNQTKAQEDQLRAQIKDHLEQISNYQNEISKLSARLDSHNENNKILNSTLTRYNKDIGLLKERNIKLEEQRKTLKERIGTFESKKNELVAKLDEMKKDLDAKTNQSNLLEKENDHLKLENNLIKQRVEELKNELTDGRKELNQIKTDYQIGSIKNELELKSQIQLLEMKMVNLQNTISAIANEKKELNDKLIENQKQSRTTIMQLKQKMLTVTNESVTASHEKESLTTKLKEAQDKLREIEQSTDDSANRTKIMKAHLELRNQLEEKRKEIAKLNEERKELYDKLKQKDNNLRQAARVNNQQIQQFEQEVEKRLVQIRKQLEESSLREKILRSKYEQRFIAQEKEIDDLKAQQRLLIESNELQQQQQHSTSIKQDQPQQSTSKQPTTATIKPLTVLSRLQQQTTTPLPQAAVTPTQTVSTVTSTNSPQTAYVVPTSVEISNVESTSALPVQTSFSLPSTSSNLTSNLASNVSSNVSTIILPNQSQQPAQDQHTFLSIESNSNLKRQRMVSFEDLNPKKQKINLIEQATEQTEQETATSSKINITDEKVIPITQKQESITTETVTETTTESDNNLIIEEQQPTISSEIETEQPAILTSTDEVVPELGKEIEDQKSNDQQQLTITTTTSNEMVVEEEGEIANEGENDENGNSSQTDESSADENDQLDEEGEFDDDEDEEGEFDEDEESDFEMNENEQQNPEDYGEQNAPDYDQENSQCNTQDKDEHSDVILLSDGDEERPATEENTRDTRTANETSNQDSISNQDSGNLNDQDEAQQAAETLGFYLHENVYPETHNSASYESNEFATSSSQPKMPIMLSMPALVSLTKAAPFTAAVESDPTIDYDNLMIDEQQQETDQTESGENLFRFTPAVTISTESTEQHQQALFAPSKPISNLSATVLQETGSLQSQTIDQTPLSSSASSEKTNQSKKVKILKRPVISKTVNEQKDKQTE